MAAPARVPLGAETLNRKWWIDVNTGTHASPTWTPVNGHSDFKPSLTHNMVDDSDCDTLTGALSEVATALSWGMEFKLMRKVTAASATVYDPGQEKLRDAAKNIGGANVCEVRFYEMNVDKAGTVWGPTTEAYQGYVAVQYSPDGGDNKALDAVSVTLSGRGDRNDITHPEGAAAAVPTIASLSPYTGLEAGGEIVIITGSGFTGTLDEGSDGVMFGATEATHYTVLSDNVISAIAPAGTGTVAVSVENATGVSTVTQNYIYT